MIPHAPYGDKLAGVYDLIYAHIEVDTAHTVRLLTELRPPPARVLELGVGTGRIALELARLGFRVDGVDGSPAMLAKLAERDVDKAVTAELADFTTYRSGREYDLVVVVLNTFFSAVTREQQLSCLRGVRKQLAPGGRFVIEVFEPTQFHAMQQPMTAVRHLGANAIMLDVVSADRSQQLMVGVHTIIDGGTPESVQHVMRYAFPGELDLLAEASGLRLENRWADFTKQPFTAASHRHVSVYVAAGE